MLGALLLRGRSQLLKELIWNPSEFGKASPAKMKIIRMIILGSPRNLHSPLRGWECRGRFAGEEESFMITDPAILVVVLVVALFADESW